MIKDILTFENRFDSAPDSIIYSELGGEPSDGSDITKNSIINIFTKKRKIKLKNIN